MAPVIFLLVAKFSCLMIEMKAYLHTYSSIFCYLITQPQIISVTSFSFSLLPIFPILTCFQLGFRKSNVSVVNQQYFERGPGLQVSLPKSKSLSNLKTKNRPGLVSKMNNFMNTTIHK
ncbi:hypothetical protein V2J09_000109 [Rumex salicifolius]